MSLGKWSMEVQRDNGKQGDPRFWGWCTDRYVPINTDTMDDLLRQLPRISEGQRVCIFNPNSTLQAVLHGPTPFGYLDRLLWLASVMPSESQDKTSTSH